MKDGLSPETLAAQALGTIDPASGAVTPPIHPSTIYEQHADGSSPAGLAYTRADNPTYDHAERLLTALEGGAACMLFSSGMAAATAVFQSLLPGDHVLVSRILYWGIRKWLAEFGVAWGLDVEFLDTGDVAALKAAIRPGRTRLLWVETPANPTWEITDLRAVGEVVRAADVRLVVDSTIATPALTRPIEFGADLVVHSATKYLNGHSDVLAGAIVTARRDAFWERIRSWRRDAGCVPGPFEAWLLQRGMRTLFVRVHRASETALVLARHFHGHPALTTVLYPGLPSHPRHDVACRQMAGGFSGMLSLRVAGGVTSAMAVVASVKLLKRTPSLGGVESLIEHRRSTEGRSSPVPDDLLRVSVGLEAPADLIADLEAALHNVTPARPVGRPSISPPAFPERVVGERDVEEAVAAVIERSIAPLVIARGGAVRIAAVHNGVVTLDASGSPGAVLPVIPQIERLLCTAVHHVSEVRVLWSGTSPGADPQGDLDTRIRGCIDNEVNRMVAAHGGRVSVVDVEEGRVRLRLEGGCQGCSLAQVTIRQGIERLLRARVPDVISVVDITDHEAGENPFYPRGKR
jgi:cystathionine gamma-synthase